MSPQAQRFFALLVLQAFSLLLSRVGTADARDVDLNREWRNDVDHFRVMLEKEREIERTIRGF